MTRLTHPVVFMRGGTSKGLFFHERDLPSAPDERDQFLLQAMGSPDPYGRQLNGMGGGISSLSKIIIVRPSQRADADIEYCHGQVAVDRPVIDYSANCGNLSSAVGPFAIDEGLFSPTTDGEALIRLHNLNSGVRIDARIPLRDRLFEPDGDFVMPGVAGTGARIALEYLTDDSSGPMFPTGHASETMRLHDGRSCRVTLVSVSLPCVFVHADEVGLRATMSPAEIEADHTAMARLEEIRREAGIRMGLAASIDDVPLATPKVGIVGTPADYVALNGAAVAKRDADIVVRMISVGQPHKAVPLTAAMTLAAACLVPGTVPNACPNGASSGGLGPLVRIGTPSGVLSVGAVLRDQPTPAVARTIAYATARRLMEGRV